MQTTPVILVLILNAVMQSLACSCPEEIKCTPQNCLIQRNLTISNVPQQQQYYPCNIVCLYSVLYKTNCSSIEDLEHVCRCGDKFYGVLRGANLICAPHTFCPPGQGVKTLGSFSSDTVCKKCVTGKEFSSTNSSTDRCEPCRHCSHSSQVVTECSPASDTVCQNDTECDDVPAPLHGAVSYSNNRKTYQEVATFTCDIGYYLSYNEQMVCEGNGQWTGSVPECKIKDCGDIPAQLHGDVSFTNNRTTYQEIATFKCDLGYYLSGFETRTCDAFGKWTGSSPDCIIRECDDVSAPSHGAVSYSNNRKTYQEVATFTCDIGYYLSYNEQMVCEGNGHWTGSVPDCKIKDCGDIPVPINGAVLFSNNRTTYQEVATFTCDLGYQLSEDLPMRCEASGNWGGSRPECIIKECDDVPAPSHGAVSYSNNRKTYQEVAIFSCDIGYYLSYNEQLVCAGNGHWTGSVPDCKIKDCGDIPVPINGAVLFSNNRTTYQEVATFTCDLGYQLSDDLPMRCEASGNWGGSRPDCIIKVIIVSNLAAIVVIIGVISIVLVVLYRKGKLHCLHRTARQDTETILRNDETDIPDNGDPELNELVESRDESDSHQTMRTRTEINNDTTDASVNVLYERHASGQQDQESSRHIGIILSATISPGTTSSGRRIPKSKSLPQGLGSAASSEKYLPRTTHSFHEDVQLNRPQSGEARKPVYPFHRALTDLSYHLCGIEWEMFFRRLIGEGSDEILGRVKRDHARSVREQIYHVLLEWKKMKASEATLNLIIKELEDLNENLLASVYRRKLSHIVYP